MHPTPSQRLRQMSNDKRRKKKERAKQNPELQPSVKDTFTREQHRREAAVRLPSRSRHLSPSCWSLCRETARRGVHVCAWGQEPATPFLAEATAKSLLPLQASVSHP